MKDEGSDHMIGVDKVKGIGPKSMMLLSKMNINNINDLVMHFPYRYEIISRSDLNAAVDGDRFNANFNKIKR